MNTTHRFRRLAVTGLVATIAAMAATALVAACAQAMGADFKVTDGDETVPVSGIAFVTGVFSVVGVGIAAALLHWSDHPAARFVQTTVALTAVSLAPPFLAPADGATTGSLVAIHLVAAAVMIPALARSLRGLVVSDPLLAG